MFIGVHAQEEDEKLDRLSSAELRMVAARAVLDLGAHASGSSVAKLSLPSAPGRCCGLRPSILLTEAAYVQCTCTSART